MSGKLTDHAQTNLWTKFSITNKVLHVDLIGLAYIYIYITYFLFNYVVILRLYNYVSRFDELQSQQWKRV